MPIMWIRESSPMTVVVESDQGEELGRMEIEGVRARDATWKIAEADDPAGGPMSDDQRFRMRRREGPQGEEYVLKLEFSRGGGPRR